MYGKHKKLNITLIATFLTTLILTNCSKSYDALYSDALNLKKQGNYPESLKNLEKAAAKKETAEVFKEMANYYIEYTREYDKAESYLIRSLEINPDYPNAIHNMGLVNIKRYEASMETTPNPKILNTAEEWLGKNLKNNPDFALSYAEYGMVQFYKNNIPDALKNMEIAKTKGANKSYVHLLLGKVYYNGLADYQMALENFNVAYNDFSKDSYLLRMLALTHKNLNQKDEAKTYFRKYVKSLQDSGAPADVIQQAVDEEARFISG